MKKIVIATVIAVCFAASSGQVLADVTTYTDEAAFKSALTVFTTYDFDSFVLDDGFIFGATPYKDLDLQIAGIDFDNSIVMPDGNGGGVKSLPNVVLNKDMTNPIVFTFSTPVAAVGLNNTSLVDAETFEIFDSADNLLASVYLPDAIINFGGFTSTVGIAKGVVTPAEPTNGSIYIDDLTVGAPIPVPSAALLGAMGLGMVGWMKRRKSEA